MTQQQNQTNKIITIVAAIPLMIAILTFGLDQQVNGQPNKEHPVVTDIRNQYGTSEEWTVLIQVNNTLPVDITVTDVTLELLGDNDALVGYISQFEYDTVPANDYGIFKITFTNDDVSTSVDDVKAMLSGASYLEHEPETENTNSRLKF